MLKKFLAGFVSAACAVVMLTSCGSKAGGTGEFATVFVTASAPAGPLDSDVATWVDATTNAKAQPCATNAVPTVLPDAVTFTVDSTAYSGGSNTTVTPSDLIVSKITLTLTPANSNSPALPSIFATQYPSAGQKIVAGSNTISVRIVPNELKQFLQSSLDCTGLNFSYRATVSFEALEVTTNRVGTITPPGFLLVNLSDFIDK